MNNYENNETHAIETIKYIFACHVNNFRNKVINFLQSLPTSISTDVSTQNEHLS